MPRRTKTMYRGWKKRAFSLLLAVSLMLGMVPGLTLTSAAEHWADSYLDQLVDWGVMRADQTSDPDTPLTRAEFMAIINRAYGYTKTGPIPFTDVTIDDWFYDDVAIAYTAGYTLGTSATTFHPNQTLNREQAVCILARNMMMEETPGENLAFSDARNVSSWARGLIKTAVDNYIVNGYPDGSFGPQDTVSKGQMASLIVQCIGTPLNKEGDYALGDVFGNVTITSSGVTLRDTTVSGDLYVSGGVGLGNVKLENVNVLGRIIVSGTGESQEGDASVVLRNVTANSMLVDNMKDQLVTLRADGLTNIGQTTVRTPAYLEDNTPDEFGLRKIDMQEAGARLTLAGRVKEVVNTAPQSTIQVAKGTVAKLTIDEDAVGSTVQLDRNTEVKELNLDTGTNVTGQGDVDKMNVNASGVTSTMLPDNIYIRPGLEANIAGEVMDSAAAEESSLDPRILSGYPQAKDVAPTSLKAEFAGNKRGTIYWGVSSITDGSITAEDLISPPSYGSVALKNGSVATPSANTVVPVNITGLTVGGSYYLSAVLVDARGERSPVKVISFTTPDNTKPAFAQGYPYISLVTDTLAQATVMATKSCKLYYAVLPQGAQAPTVNDLKSAAVTGNLGYGVVDVVKNTELPITISRQLEELKNYVAYFWLTDADGANSSNIVSLRFTTKDTTPPVFDPDPYLNSDPKDTSVSLTTGLNEAGTIYWVVVPRGERYPLPNNQNDDDNITNASGEKVADLTKEWAKSQVKNGRNATKRGSVSVRNADTDVTINITGLTRATAYDLYYVAQDTAGNFSAEVKKMAINTADNTAPTVKQSFSPNGGDPAREPLVTSKITLEFSEDVLSSTGAGSGKSLLTLRDELSDRNQAVKDQAIKDLVEFLSQSIELWKTDTVSTPKKVTIWDGKGTTPTGDWLNYSKAVIVSTTTGGAVKVELPYSATKSESAHSLSSGATYYFRIMNIEDNSDSRNSIKDGNGNDTTELTYDNMGTVHNIPTFTTVFAQVILSSPTLGPSRPLRRADNSYDINHTANSPVAADFHFRMVPDATETVDESNSYDLELFSDTNLSFDLYCRIRDTSVTDETAAGAYLSTQAEAKTGGVLTRGNADTNHWFYIGNSGETVHPGGAAENWRGVSVIGKDGLGNVGNDPFPKVSDLKHRYTYDFVITVTSIAGRKNRSSWTDTVKFEAYVLAGDSGRLDNLAGNSSKDRMKEFTDMPLTSGGLASIGTDLNAGRKYLAMDWTFTDTRVPAFYAGYPNIQTGADWADVNIMMDRAGQYYYVVAPYNRIGTQITSTDDPNLNELTGLELWNVLPVKGQNTPKNDGSGTFNEVYKTKDGASAITVTTPNAQGIMDSRTYTQYKPEPLPVTYEEGNPEVTIELRRLEPRTKYIIYFVLKGKADTPSPVFAYAFETTDTGKPHITIAPNSSEGSATLETQVAAKLLFRTFTVSHANNINELMAEFSADAGTANDKFAASSYASSVKTVLAALTTKDSSGASVFDVYATDDEKDKIADLIANNRYTTKPGTSAVPVDFSPTNTSYKETTERYEGRHTVDLTPADLRNMRTYPTEYVLLVMGHHASSDESRASHEIDAFSAYNPFYKTDTEPPVLIGFSATPAGNPSTGGSYTSTLTFRFNKNLYWAPGTGNTSARVPVGQSNKSYTASSTVGITYNRAPGGGTFSAVTPTNDGPVSTFTVLAVLPKNTEIQILTNGQFTNEAGGGNTGDTLSIIPLEGTFKNKKTGLEFTGVHFVAYWNGQLVSDDVELMG